MWELTGHKGIRVNPNGSVSLTAARSEFLPPKAWKRVLIPYKASIVGATTFVCGLQRPGLVAGLSITKGGQMNINIFNSLQEVVHLTPKTVLVNIHGANVSVQEFGKQARQLAPPKDRRRHQSNDDGDRTLICSGTDLEKSSQGE